MNDKKSLMKRIYETGFALYDAVLFLDTHPQCKEALEYFNAMQEEYSALEEEYGERFGALSLSMAGKGEWGWTDAPMPWEGE